jgi:hypothetical protein
VYALLALLGALAVVIVQLVTGLKSGLTDEHGVALHIVSQLLAMLFSLIAVVGTSRHLIEEIKSVLVSWRRVQAQFDKEIEHLAESLIPTATVPRLKS